MGSAQCITPAALKPKDDTLAVMVIALSEYMMLVKEQDRDVKRVEGDDASRWIRSAKATVVLLWMNWAVAAVIQGPSSTCRTLSKQIVLQLDLEGEVLY